MSNKGKAKFFYHKIMVVWRNTVLQCGKNGCGQVNIFWHVLRAVYCLLGPKILVTPLLYSCEYVKRPLHVWVWSACAISRFSNPPPTSFLSNILLWAEISAPSGNIRPPPPFQQWNLKEPLPVCFCFLTTPHSFLPSSGIMLRRCF